MALLINVLLLNVVVAHGLILIGAAEHCSKRVLLITKYGLEGRCPKAIAAAHLKKWQSLIVKLVLDLREKNRRHSEIDNA